MGSGPAAHPRPYERARSLRTVMLVLAVACGAGVANLYYAQPLLDLIGRSFGVGQGAATTVVSLTQLGYAIGLALVLPLGDLLENRKLAARTLLVTAAALAGAALAPGLGVFLAVSLLIGVTSVVVQILVPLAAHLAPEQSRGRYVGQVMSGLLLGIMLARSLASFAAAAWGWRSIYAISAVLMLVIALALVKVLPVRRPEHRGSYGALLASTLRLARTEPVLVRRALTQALLFGAFTAYWTAVAFVLIDRHRLSQTGIAVFALVGAAGAASAPVAGRLGDAGHGRAGRLVAIATAVLAMLVAGFGAGHLVLLALAGVLLDAAVQGHQVLSQRDIYSLAPHSRARANSVFMTCVFSGGALASALTGAVHESQGWTGVTVFGGVLAAGAAVIWAAERRR